MPSSGTTSTSSATASKPPPEPVNKHTIIQYYYLSTGKLSMCIFRILVVIHFMIFNFCVKSLKPWH